MSTLVQLIPVAAGKKYLALYDDGQLYWFVFHSLTVSGTMTPIRVELAPRPAEAEP